MLSSISRLAGLAAIGCFVSAASSRADVVIPLPPAPVVVVPAPGPQKIILNVCHPCNGCHYDVPVCLPACCEGVPRVSHHRALFGCGRVVYEWCCGYRVVIRFNRHGSYRVAQG